MREPLRRTALALGLPVVLVAVWWVASAGSTSFFWPPLSAIVTAVLADVAIDLPAERSQLVTRSSVRFTELRGQVYELVQQAKKGTAYDGVTQEGLREG